jgi:hypothetical protein
MHTYNSHNGKEIGGHLIAGTKKQKSAVMGKILHGHKNQKSYKQETLPISQQGTRIDF